MGGLYQPGYAGSEAALGEVHVLGGPEPGSGQPSQAVGNALDRLIEPTGWTKEDILVLAAVVDMALVGVLLLVEVLG
jgi:hypothetical protein